MYTSNVSYACVNYSKLTIISSTAGGSDCPSVQASGWSPEDSSCDGKVNVSNASTDISTFREQSSSWFKQWSSPGVLRVIRRLKGSFTACQNTWHISSSF